MQAPLNESPRAELKRLEGELHFERGVSTTLLLIAKGADPETLAQVSDRKTEELMQRYKRLKERIR